MMKYFCFGLAFSLTGFLVACGSGSNSNPVTYTSGVTSGVNTGCVNGYCTTPGVLGIGTNTINGGTEQVTPMLSNYTTPVPSSKTFPTTLPVVAGDRIVVLLGGSYQTTTSSWINTSSTLSSVNVNVAGILLGNQLNAEYAVTVPGTLSVSVDWPLSSSNSGTHNIVTGTGNVYVLHCLTTAGAQMACPVY
jgi:hypothetical protein